MNTAELIGPNGEGMSNFPHDPRRPWEFYEGLDGLEQDIYHYIGCMHMASIFRDKRYPPEAAIAASRGFNPVHMRNLGKILWEEGSFESDNWPAIHATELAST